MAGRGRRRDTDKIREAGTSMTEGGTHFAEARLVLAWRKLYFQDISPDRFLDLTIEGMYPKKDYNSMYVGEIKKCLLRAS